MVAGLRCGHCGHPGPTLSALRRLRSRYGFDRVTEKVSRGERKRQCDDLHQHKEVSVHLGLCKKDIDL